MHKHLLVGPTAHVVIPSIRPFIPVSNQLTIGSLRHAVLYDAAGKIACWRTVTVMIKTYDHLSDDVVRVSKLDL